VGRTRAADGGVRRRAQGGPGGAQIQLTRPCRSR
jgi:hypothetical protein